MKRPPIRVYADGREVCDLKSKAGNAEYHLRKWAMFHRQKGICCLFGHIPDCPGRMGSRDVSFDHENPRGMGGGSRDDRIVLPDGTWLNGAAHFQCNFQKGSRRIAYNHA